MVDRTHRELKDDEILSVAGVYHAWRGEPDAGDYVDVPGFCATAALDAIAEHRYVLTPGRYVGAEDTDVDDEPPEERVKRLAAEVSAVFAEAAELTERAQAALRRLEL
jgi:type I restriction enzyme M protein